jgi:competence protein ComEA
LVVWDRRWISSLLTKGEMVMQKSKTRLIMAVVFVAALIMAAMPGYTADDKIDINSASIEQLMSLKYVGETIAKRIVEYRDQIQGFKTVEAIMEVKGFGQKAWEANKDRITVMPYKKQ